MPPGKYSWQTATTATLCCSCLQASLTPSSSTTRGATLSPSQQERGLRPQPGHPGTTAGRSESRPHTPLGWRWVAANHCRASQPRGLSGIFPFRREAGSPAPRSGTTTPSTAVARTSGSRSRAGRKPPRPGQKAGG